MSSRQHTRAYLSAVLPPPRKQASFDTSDGPKARIDDQVQPYLRALEADGIAEDDRPEALKDLFAASFAASDSDDEVPDLDSLVLSLLHRHREDLEPTGQTFSPTTPIKSSVPLSRSSSFTRTITPNTGIGARRAVSGLPMRSHSPSTLRPQSPALESLKRDGEASLPSSPPLSSPRLLSVAANEFQPRGTSSSTLGIILPALSSPTLGSKQWKAAVAGRTGSPLGTPRTSSGGSYFPSITRDPWAPVDSMSASSIMPTSSTSVSSESSNEEPADVDPFSPWDMAAGLSKVDVPTSEVKGPFDIDWINESSGSGRLFYPSDEPSPQQHARVLQRQSHASPNSPTVTTIVPQIEYDAPQNVYTMTPMDMLCSVFAGTDITPEEVEHALSRNGWDIDKAMDWLIARPPQSKTQGDLELTPSSPSILGSSPASASRPSPVHRESYRRLQTAGLISPNGSAPSSPRWGSRPQTPLAGPPNPTSYPASAATNRVCRYYLQGGCLRSDCRYNHDISKAVCRFWLRGHCLKGPERCDFMHHIPTHLTADVALLRLRDRAERAERHQQAQHAHMVEDLFRDDQDDFPSLCLSPSGPLKQPIAQNGVRSSARWSGAVKEGRSGTRISHRQDANHSVPAATLPASRASVRLALRPPTLMPTLSTGQTLTGSYTAHRTSFTDLGAARAKCLQRAAECYRKGDYEGARSWSREARAHNTQRLAAGREAARTILHDRKAELKAAVGRDNQRDGRVDAFADRTTRGKDCGADLGILLGVAASAAVTNGSSLSSAERTEAALDLHGLHAEEAVDATSNFLSGLEREGFLGLAYLFVGQERHTIRQQTRTRLADAVIQHLDDYKYPFRTYTGTIVIDPLQHI